MSPDRTLTLRRVPLALVCRTLSATDLQILLALVVGACPRTARVWTTPLRLAEEFNVAPVLVDVSLASLIALGHLALWSRSTSACALRCYEVGPVLVRRLDEPPDNLPVGPLP